MESTGDDEVSACAIRAARSRGARAPDPSGRTITNATTDATTARLMKTVTMGGA
jgi:hypothetical protein